MKEQKRNKDFDRILVESVQKNYKLFVWQSIAGVVEKCELKIKAFRKDYSEIEVEICTGEERNLENVISGSRIFNVYIPEASITFVSELKSISADRKIKLYIPETYSFYERRRNLRVQPSSSCYVNFEYNKRNYKKKIFDVSIGGIAIVVPKVDRINIPYKSLIANLVVEIGTKKLKIPSECLSTVSINKHELEHFPYGGFKIVFRFKTISKQDYLYLEEFIRLESMSQEVHKKVP